SPALIRPYDGVLIGDASARTVGVDADALGPGVHSTVGLLAQDDIRDVVADRVPVAEGAAGVGAGRHPSQDLLPEVGDVVDDVDGEHLVEAIEFSAVAQVSVQRDQLGDEEPIFAGESHQGSFVRRARRARRSVAQRTAVRRCGELPGSRYDNWGTPHFATRRRGWRIAERRWPLRAVRWLSRALPGRDVILGGYPPGGSAFGGWGGCSETT